MSGLDDLYAFRAALVQLSKTMGRIVFYGEDGHPILDSADYAEDGRHR